VSNERQHGGVEKKTPIDTSLTKADEGHRTANGVNPTSTPTSCFTIANPMPIKRKPPLTAGPRANGGILREVRGTPLLI